jgi:hypothetical protein
VEARVRPCFLISARLKTCPFGIMRLNRRCLAWNGKRPSLVFDIKAGGVGISRKFWRLNNYFITKG